MFFLQREEEAAAHFGENEKEGTALQSLTSLGFEQLKSSLGWVAAALALGPEPGAAGAAALTIASAGPGLAWLWAGLGGYPGLEGVKLFTAFWIVCSSVLCSIMKVFYHLLLSWR